MLVGRDADVASNARWKEPPITQPLHATMTGASMSHMRWMPRWPRRISSWCESGTCKVPIEPTSRPDENDLPSPRQITARMSGRPTRLVEDLEQLQVHVVVERVVLFRIVVGDRRDRAVDVEPHRACHRCST